MSKRQQVALIFMCWALYTSAYLGRYSFNSNILPIETAYGFTSAESGLVGSMFFFAYGAGQIINGILCKYYNVKYVLSLSMIISAIINAVVFFGVLPPVYLKFLWLINGFSQSFLWSSLIMTLSRNLDEHYIKKAIFAMSTTASIGTFLSYGLSALLATSNAFIYSFFVASVLMAIMGILWFILCSKITDKNAVVIVNQTDGQLKSKKMDNSVVKVLVLFGLFAIIVNLMKDGLTTWVPKVLKTNFNMPDSFSILLTLILPVLVVFGTSFVMTLNKKIKDYKLLMAVLFVISSVFMTIVVLLLSSSAWYVVLVSFGLTTLCMGGANNIITSILPLSLRDKANSGFLSGILNGCCYVGSTISSFGLGALFDFYQGWSPIFIILLILCVSVVVLAVGTALGERILSKKKKHIDG